MFNSKSWIHFSIMLFFILLLFSGCAPKANLAIGNLYTGNYQKAWNMISMELENPSVSSQKDLCEVRCAALQILRTLANYDFMPSDPDKTAKASYEYIFSNCQDYKDKIMISENNYGLYFLNTRRPGPAIRHFKSSKKLAGSDSFGNCANENNIASCYADMGKFELRDHYRKSAIEIGKEYLKTGFKSTKRKYNKRLGEFSELNNFVIILQARLDELSWQKPAQKKHSEMRELWSEIKDIVSKPHFSKETRYVFYIRAIQAFSFANDTKFARQLLVQARELTRKYPYKNKSAVEVDLQSAEAKILEAEGKFKEAATLWDDWIKRFPKASNRHIPGNEFRLAGLAFESAKMYDRSIDCFEKSLSEFEKMRYSFKVKDRGEVISGLVATTYWGLLRSYVRKYLIHKNEQDFQGAIRAARMLRARQFGELIGIDPQVNDGLNFSELKLDPNELLVNIILTDRAIIVFVLAKDWHDVFITPYVLRSFIADAKKAKDQISKPSDSDMFIRYIQSISEVVLNPVKDRLDRYKKLIVIPDGMLNGIPFNLLSVSSEEYYPLILNHEIILTPSLSYLIKTRNLEYRSKSDSLLAFADPVYGSRKIPIEYQDDTRGFYVQTVNHLNLFDPLPETRTEVQNIVSLFNHSDITTFFGEEAAESKIKSLDLIRYRYLHFATHGILGNQIPGIDEPALVLAKENNQDGFLTLSEVESLKLDSDLTVLSACNTGSGEYYTGEGVMGLSRGFLLAGSRSVLVSLWPVSSKATVELMTVFYEHLKSGKSKTESLRLAQLAIRDHNKAEDIGERGIVITSKKELAINYTHPFYWSPFVLIGE